MADTKTTVERQTLAFLAAWVLTVLCGAAVLVAWIRHAPVLWMSHAPAGEFALSGPDMDDPYGRKKRMATGDNVKIGTVFQTGPGTASALPGVWPWFRGPQADNVARDAGPLADAWPSNGPAALWSVDLGEGHAGAAVRNGRVYILDHDETRKADILRCLSLDDGREIWRRGYKVDIKRNHGISRTVPTVTEDTVVTIGPKAHVMAVDAVSGALKWGFGMVARYGTKIPGWYTAQCPLVDGEHVILAPGGSNVLMLAVGLQNGETVWSLAPPVKCDMSHASIVATEALGRRQYVYAGIGCMVGVSAAGADRGKLLWSTTEWSASTIAPTPVVFPDGKIFCTAGYGAGSAVFQLSREGDTFRIVRVRAYKPRDGFACEQQTPVPYDGLLFGVLPKEAVALKNQFACADRDGKVLWSSGKEARFGLGPVLAAHGKFFILDDEGVLTMVRARKDAYEQLAQAKVLEGHDSWGPIAVAGSRMLVRDSKRMVCLEMSGTGSTAALGPPKEGTP
jgi:outer membrane protein assembly factor BamB